MSRSARRRIKLNLNRLLFRAWFYFRIGYGTYISLPVGIASNLVVLYELAIIDNKLLHPIFPSLTFFAVLAILVFFPVGSLLGLYHMKRTPAFAADASVQTESNPYVYKIIPGKEQEVLYPLIALTAKGLSRVLEQQQSLSAEEKREFEDALNKANALMQGQPVGLPSKLSQLTKPMSDDQR
jgi:hypothetical protein